MTRPPRSLTAQISELELSLRERRSIARTPGSVYRAQTLEDALATLKWLQRHETAIREAVEKSAASHA